MSVPCLPLTRKRNTVQCSCLHGRLPTWGVTGRASFRSQCQRSGSQGKEMWKLFSAHIFASIHVKARPQWRPFHTARFVQQNVARQKCVLFEVTGRQNGNTLHHAHRVGTHVPTHLTLCWCAHRCKSRTEGCISLLALAALTCLQSCASTPNGVAIFLKGDAECRWVVSKIVTFGQHLALSRKQYKTEPYYGMRIGNRTHAFEWYHFEWPWMTPTEISRSRRYLTLNILETVWDTYIVTVEYQ